MWSEDKRKLPGEIHTLHLVDKFDLFIDVFDIKLNTYQTPHLPEVYLV